MAFQPKILAAALALASGFACAGPIGTYYVTDPNGFAGEGQIYGFRGAQMWKSPMVQGAEGPLAVYQDQEVRTIGWVVNPYATEGWGSNYTGSPLFLSPQPGHNENTATDDLYFDGTSDGTYNYAVGIGNAAIVRFNADWTHPTELFTVPGDYWYGITYDKTNDSLWLYGDSGALVNVSKTGTSLASMFVPGSLNTTTLRGLAMDMDHTLWLVGGQGYDRLVHLSTTGALLGEELFNGGPAMPLGGEIAAIPEPSSLVLTGLGGLMLAIRTLRRRKVD